MNPALLRGRSLSLALLPLLLLVGCGKGNFSSKTSEGKENTFRYPLITNPTHIDPALVEDLYTGDLTQNIFEGLVKWDEKNQVAPNLADSWDISKDGKTYTFHLKPGVKFSNGREVTADDFKFSLERACDPKLKSVTVGEYLDDVVGVLDKSKGKTDHLDGVRVIDPKTLEIRLTQARPYFLGKLTYPCSYVVCKEVAGTSEIQDVPQMVGTGPFVATKYVEDQTFNMAANPTYHGGKPPIDAIERPILKDASTRLNKFKAHELDMITVVRQDIKAIQAEPDLAAQLKFFDRPSIEYLAFNTRVFAPFGDKRVRQAISMAIDTRKIADKVLGNLTFGNGILPPGVEGHREKTALLPYDPAKAKALLASAGYNASNPLPTLELYGRADDEDSKYTAQSIQSDLQHNLGITVTIKPIDWTTMLSKVDRKEIPMYAMAWSADYLDPQDFLSNLLTTSGANNRTNYSNPQADAWCATADTMAESNPQRMKLYAEAEDAMLQDAAWLPLYFSRDADLISPKVKGLRSSIFGFLPHSTVALSK